MALILLATGLAIVAGVWLRSQPPGRRKPAAIKLAALAVAVALMFMALTGRLYIVAGLLAVLFPLLRRLLPGLLMGHLGSKLRGGQARPSAGNESHVTTDILDMTLDHDSGEMTGKVLEGPLAGRELADLGETEFIDLLRYCRQRDADSARLLETYLDRRFGDSWRTDDPGTEEQKGSGEAGNGSLTENEARDILGVEPGASRDEIIQAHRRMMQKMHPDRGGSNYLAARINEAKELLLS